jgi:hypothetical protein
MTRPAARTSHAPDPLAERAAMARLLAAGGDERIVLDPETGLNRYGCAASPRDDIAAFGSSTASVISQTAAEAVARSMARLAEGPPQAAYAREVESLRRTLTGLCGLPASEARNLILAASGTDLHLIAAVLASDGRSAVTCVMAHPAETGRGVPDAVRARRFAALTPHGRPGEAGETLAGAAGGETVAIAVREADGRPRPAEAVDADFERACEAAVASGGRVLLNLVDVSKTGLIAPSLGCASRIRARFADRVTVLVDACQFRISTTTVAHYLARGFMVAVTGSKFVTGPAFSGALLVPPTEARKLDGKAILPALGDYCGLRDWPASWLGRGLLPDRPNPGMLLRWQAAAHELAAFRALPEAEVSAFLARFAAEVSATLAELPGLEPLAAPRLDRTSPESWDAQRTIFAFLPTGRDGPLSPEAAQALHRRLLAALRPIQLGQPVAIGARDGRPLTALRLSASARLIVEALATPGGCEAVIERARAALAATSAQAWAS